MGVRGGRGKLVWCGEEGTDEGKGISELVQTFAEVFGFALKHSCNTINYRSVVNNVLECLPVLEDISKKQCHTWPEMVSSYSSTTLTLSLVIMKMCYKLQK